LRNKNKEYQSIVDLVTKRLRQKKTEELLAMPNLSRTLEGDLEVAIWHHDTVNNEHHFVVQAQKKIFLFFWKNYLNGIIVKNNSEVVVMPNETVANYD
jgi:hypothetical protein